MTVDFSTSLVFRSNAIVVLALLLTVGVSAQSINQDAKLPGFTIVYEQTVASSESDMRRLRGIHVRYQRSDCWTKEVRTTFQDNGTPGPAQIQQYLKRDHRRYTAEALRRNPSFDREEKVLGVETLVLRDSPGGGSEDFIETYFAPELQGIPLKQVVVKKGVREVLEPISILLGEPDEKILVRELASGTPKKIDFTYGILEGTASKRVEPAYPAEAKNAGVAGAVLVQIMISETGKVIDAVPVSGHPLLYAKALEAARQWVFAPTEISAEAVKVQNTLTFNFTP